MNTATKIIALARLDRVQQVTKPIHHKINDWPAVFRFVLVLVLTTVAGDPSVKVTLVHFDSLAATAALHGTHICTLGP